MNLKDMITEYSPIAQTPNFIVLDEYTKRQVSAPSYQTERELEADFIRDLQQQGYEYRPDITSPQALLANARVQLERLNGITFSDGEWSRFLSEYLDRPSDSLTDKSRKIQEDHIYDFTFDDGHIQNIYLVDKVNIVRNKLQVINQFEQNGSCNNRYDVTILVNGLPLVHIELKARGKSIREAFNQVHRYSKESFNSESSLYKYVQFFVISNGTDTRYFANTLKRDKSSYEFTMNWARSDNRSIKDLCDFTATFFQKNTLLKILLHYSVFNQNGDLLIMRPYQIAAAERILWKITSAHHMRQWGTTEGGGYIWHTTGSGKTLTSFKAARLATQLDFIEKVFFVVDRKDLDYQTMKEYQHFSPDSVNGSPDTAGLLKNIEKRDNRIIVTTIQKLNNLMRSGKNLGIYDKEVVFIFDECHRSQFGEAQKNLKQKFKRYYQFGFTGTPIFPENAPGSETTASVFGRELHSYVITDAIRDEKVLKFNVDYNNVRPQFKVAEQAPVDEELSAREENEILMHPERIKQISKYILLNFKRKTHREKGAKGFNAMLAVSSVAAAKCYYQQLKELQEGSNNPLKIATIFSYAPNEEQRALGEIQDESFEPSAMDQTAKEFLGRAIGDYNEMFGTSYGLDAKSFQDYYKDLSNRVKNQEVDLLIVVGMFLTGFDAPRLNTLFVDKNLRYHGLIQAYSRTNRIYDSTKPFGNIVTFRDLEQATINAITLFGDKNTSNVVLEKSYEEYLQGFTDILTGESKRGYNEIVKELKKQFPDPTEIDTESDKLAFVKLFGDYLKVENVLRNYDQFTYLQELQKVDQADPKAMEEFMESHFLTEKELSELTAVDVLPERMVQDYRSCYNEIREWLRRKRELELQQETPLKYDWDNVIFEVDLLRSQEINLDYILALILEHKQMSMDKDYLIDEARRMAKSSLENRAKEELLVDFINETNLDIIKEKSEMIEAFFKYAQERQRQEAADLIATEQLNEAAAKRYIQSSLKKEYASENGTDLENILPRMSPLNPKYLSLKKEIHAKISQFVEKFKGIGGQL